MHSTHRISEPEHDTERGGSEDGELKAIGWGEYKEGLRVFRMRYPVIA
jgi:hypothetical protein